MITKHQLRQCALHLFNVRDIRQHFCSVMADIEWEFGFESRQPDGRYRIPWSHYWSACCEVATCRLTAAWCELHGHEWEAVFADGENGTEDLVCSRCGIGQHIQW